MIPVTTQDCGIDEIEVHIKNDKGDHLVEPSITREGSQHLVSFSPTLHCKYQVLAFAHGEQISGKQTSFPSWSCHR